MKIDTLYSFEEFISIIIVLLLGGITIYLYIFHPGYKILFKNCEKIGGKIYNEIDCYYDKEFIPLDSDRFYFIVSDFEYNKQKEKEKDDKKKEEWLKNNGLK